MKTFKNKTVKVLDQTICDVCGKTCTDDFYHSHENATLEAMWGYGSKSDGAKFEVHLCEHCFYSVLNFIRDQRSKVLGSFDYPHQHDPLYGESET